MALEQGDGESSRLSGVVLVPGSRSLGHILRGRNASWRQMAAGSASLVSTHSPPGWGSVP